MLLVNSAHKGSGWRQDLVNEDENGLLWGKLDPLPDHIDELANGEILIDTQMRLTIRKRDLCGVRAATHRWYKVLLLVDCGDIGAIGFLADDL